MSCNTIAAIATAAGKGGIGIVRLSGENALAIAEHITHKKLTPRSACYSHFFSCIDNNVPQKVDDGIAIYFPSPLSFTGEDVVELQAHGSKIILDILLNECIRLGARLAKPGEFSERAFLNDKIDLVQAEAIADIIESNSISAAIAARRSLNGEFSKIINSIVSATIELRKYVEASIDFPEEEIDYVDNNYITNALNDLFDRLQTIWSQAKTGTVLRDGISAIIIGEPNSGKSSLINCLANDNIAIVNDRAGTTRDLLKEDISIGDITVQFIDTAGLRITHDEVEVEGISRISRQLDRVNIIIWVRDLSCQSTTLDPSHEELLLLLENHNIKYPEHAQTIAINNKIDTREIQPCYQLLNDIHCISLSAKHNAGIDLLKNCILNLSGVNISLENTFTARRRHLDILTKTQSVLKKTQLSFQQNKTAELLAEDLRIIQNLLGEITGQFTSDELLGEIFSSFCIGK